MTLIVGLILAFLKAFPAAAQLFHEVSDKIREQQAQARLSAKDAAVDDLLAPYRTGGVRDTGNQAGQQPTTGAPTGLPTGSSGGTGLGK